MSALRAGWARLVLAVVLPVAVAAAWIPVRESLPNADLALILIVVIAAVGWLTDWRFPLVSALAAAVAFDVLDARPYGTLTISRGVDVTTALILLVTGMLVGAGSARLARYHKSEDHRSDALAVVMEASRLVATGEEQQLIAGALGEELVRSLDLLGCEFRAQPPDGKRLSVARDGSLVGLVSSTSTSDLIDLPVWCRGDVVAYFRLTLGTRKPTREEWRVAISLADQAGAAMARAADGGPPGPDGSTGRRSRLSRTPASARGQWKPSVRSSGSTADRLVG